MIRRPLHLANARDAFPPASPPDLSGAGLEIAAAVDGVRRAHGEAGLFVRALAAGIAEAADALTDRERALDLVRRNAQRLGLDNVRAVLPDEVPDDVRLAALWSNPPIRVGKDVLHGMLLHWLPRLAPGASAHLVVQRNLGSDSLQRWLAEALPPLLPGAVVERAASAKGFRVLEVVAPR